MSLKVVPVAAGKGVQFSLSSIIYVFGFLILMLGFILTAVMLTVVAQNQNVIFATAGKVGLVLQNFVNNGQSLSSTVSQCVRPFKIFWNVLWTFIFAIIHRIANANNANFFAQYARFNIINVLCDLILPTFEVVVNFLIIVLNFVLSIVLVFLQFVVSLGLGNFDAFDVVLQVLFEAFLDTIDKDNCIHPRTGPLGFPGNALKCMGCTIPVPIMNQDTTTKTNALFVCFCGGDIHGDTLTNVEGCIHLQDVINAFTTFAGYFVTAYEFVQGLVANANQLSVIWTGIQDTYNKIANGLSPIKKAVCAIPFVCKILKIRSLPNGADDPYICSYTIDNPNDPPLCFYESEFHLTPLNITYTPVIEELRNQLNQIVMPYFAPRHPSSSNIRSTTSSPSSYHTTPFEQDVERKLHTAPKPPPAEVESPFREFAIAASVFLKHLPGALNTGKVPKIDVFKREFHDRNFRPHEVRRGLHRLMRQAKLTPLNFDDHETFKRYNDAREQDKRGANVPELERLTPPPATQILFSITSVLVSFSMNGVTNLSKMTRSLGGILLPIGATLVPVVVQLAFGAIQDIVPTSIISSFPIFNLFGPISDIFTPLYNLDFTQQVPVATFTAAFIQFSNLVDDVLASKVGVVIAQYILSLGFLITMDANNRPPVHPDIANISQLLTVMANCNPDQSCHTPDDCGLSQCNCNNGTVVATSDGYCQNTGNCYCFPMIIVDSPTPATTIDLSINLVGEDYGYVTHNPIWPFTSIWGSVVNALSTFWNGALPHILTELMWGIYVPWFTLILHYTIGWCRCCKPITGFGVKLTIIGTSLSMAAQALAWPANNYCAYRSVFYCRLFNHFFRNSSPTWGQRLLFGANTSTSSFGLLLTVVIIIVSSLFIILMLTSLILLFKEFLVILYRIMQYNYQSGVDQAEEYETRMNETPEEEIEEEEAEDEISPIEEIENAEMELESQKIIDLDDADRFSVE
jgi:hypothetical protein